MKILQTMRIFLVRHGESTYNIEKRMQGHADTPLTAAGEYQASTLGKILAARGIRFHVAYSSDLQRAAKTAELIIGGQCQLHKEKGFRERDIGELQGMLRVKAKAKAEAEGKAMTDYGEASVAQSRRLAATWNSMVSSIERDFGPGASVLLVTHGGSLRKLVKYLIDSGDVKAGAAAGQLENVPGNCSVTIVEHGEFVVYADQPTESIETEADLI